MRRLLLASRAERAIRTILGDSADRFGIAAAERYRALLEAAYEDIRERPSELTLSKVVRTPAGYGLYHVRHSVRRLPVSQRVRQPRHLLAFRFDDDRVVILDVFHDRMDLPSRLAELLNGRDLPPAP